MLAFLIPFGRVAGFEGALFAMFKGFEAEARAPVTKDLPLFGGANDCLAWPALGATTGFMVAFGAMLDRGAIDDLDGGFRPLTGGVGPRDETLLEPAIEPVAREGGFDGC